MDYSSLFQPIRIGSKVAKNRIEIAPAAPFLAGHDGSLSREYYEYNRNLAQSGAGIVTLGVTPVDPPGCNVGSRVMRIGSDLFLPDFNELAEMMHRYGALACAELVYSKYMLMNPQTVVNETTTEEVESIISCFAQAARRLLVSGFDMAFVHGGHGNVPAMFFSKAINKRTDRFGGSFEGRCQFAVELLQAIRAECGDGLAVEYRISAEEMLPGSTTLEETLAFAKVIEPYIDLLHVSRGILEVDNLVHYINAPLYLPRALNLPFAARFKEELDIPVTVVGSFDLETADKAISEGKVDMVSMIRAIYADTRCVEKARRGMANRIRPCLRCNTCIDRTHTTRVAVRCAVNPLLGRETRFDEKACVETPLKVAVVGGGPAGMQAARTLAERGHAPILYEKTHHLGGLLRLAAADEMKLEVKQYLDWAISETTSDERISVRLGTNATPELLQQEGIEAVILAIGCEPVTPTFSHMRASETADSAASAETRRAASLIWVGDVDSGNADPGNSVVIAGGGMTGMECALSLARRGKQVTLVDPKPKEQLGRGGAAISVRCLIELLEKEGVTFICESRVVSMQEDGALVQRASGAMEIVPCDSVVHSLGFSVNQKAATDFEKTFFHCYRVGDCRGGAANVFNATQTAFDAAMSL